MKNGLELYKYIGEKNAKKLTYRYEVATHLYTDGKAKYYRVKINRFLYVQNILQARHNIFTCDYPLTDVYNTRAKVIARAKLDAGLWRVKTATYSY